MLRNLSRSACRVLSECCLLALLALSARAQPLTFTTFAGTAGGPGSVDGTGSAARFGFPSGVAIDGGGNVYVADTDRHTIRKITPAGVVRTLAGSAGLRGSEDGTGSAARFSLPMGLATDRGGNVYVADADNGTIRRITPMGAVTTLAGSGLFGSMAGTGSAAHFPGAWAVATDGGGNLYVAVAGDETIRKITSSGVMTTLAGSAGLRGSEDGTAGDARFNFPSGVAADGDGNVYVVETQNSTIRKITSAGVVTTLAGSAGSHGSADGTGVNARFSRPSGVATDSAGNVYVADQFNYTVRKITSAGVVTTLAGSAGRRGSADGTGVAARFFSPSGVATDSGGNVFVTDYDNHTIRKITPAGAVTTVAGLAAESGSVDGTGSAARFSQPFALATDGGGNVYVVDSASNMIRKITPDGVVTTLAGSGQQGSADGTGGAARFYTPTGVACDGGGNVYVTDNSNLTIRQITPAGVVTTLAGSPGMPGSVDGIGNAARFFNPSGVATDSGGNLYVTDFRNHTVRKIMPDGVVTTVAGAAGVSGSADGTGGAARFAFPTGVATDSGGNVYVADQYNSTIRKITQAGVVTTLAGSPGLNGSTDGTGSAARFSVLIGMTTDSSGNVYVADPGNQTIRKITPAGVVTTVAGTTGLRGSADGPGSVASFSNASGVAIDSAGNIYVADSDNNKIRVGRPALADVATIDISTGLAGEARQLGTSPQTATSWQWRIIRQPSGSTAALSSSSIRNPVFKADVADLYLFELTASDGVRTSITTVSLTATPVVPRRHAVRP